MIFGVKNLHGGNESRQYIDLNDNFEPENRQVILAIPVSDIMIFQVILTGNPSVVLEKTCLQSYRVKYRIQYTYVKY